MSQESDVIEEHFRIVSTIIQTEGFTLTSNDREYLRGEKVLLRGITDPDVWVDLDIFDSNKIQLRISTKSDADGRYNVEYTISTNAVIGKYEVKATVGDKQVNVKFSVVLTKSSSTSTSNNLTIETDRSPYNRGDFVTVVGKGKANEKVTILVEPPRGDNLLLTVNPDSSGNYRSVFGIKQGTFTGQWKLTAKQGTDAATIDITVI